MRHLQAGTAIAGTAPLKFNTGTPLATPEDGALEYDTSHLWFTIGGIRYQLDQQTAAASGITRSIFSVALDTTAGSTAAKDYVYLVSGTTTLTLPTAVSNTNLYTIKNVGTKTVTIAFTGGQTADGSATLSLPVRYTSLSFISDDTNWNIV